MGLRDGGRGALVTWFCCPRVIEELRGARVTCVFVVGLPVGWRKAIAICHLSVVVVVCSRWNLSRVSCISRGHEESALRLVTCTWFLVVFELPFGLVTCDLSCVVMK